MLQRVEGDNKNQNTENEEQGSKRGRVVAQKGEK